MELFIEKEFLRDFYNGFDESYIQEIVKNIITDYGDKRVFINGNENDFNKLKEENEFFMLITANGQILEFIDNIKEHVSKIQLNQTLIFTKSKEEWFEEIENKGALCFTFDNYQQKIKAIMKSLHFKIDLSKQFPGWDFLDAFKNINYNKIIVTDSYVLGDKTDQKMDDNIIPVLKKLVLDKKNKRSVTFFTKDLSSLTNQARHIKEKAKKRVSRLQQIFKNENIKIINSNLSHRITQNFDMHDRNIATNFSLLDSGKGFNLVPHYPSNSQIISETIFDKYTYDRLNTIFRLQKEYINQITNKDMPEFKQFPI